MQWYQVQSSGYYNPDNWGHKAIVYLNLWQIKDSWQTNSNLEQLLNYNQSKMCVLSHLIYTVPTVPIDDNYDKQDGMSQVKY